MKKLRLSIIFFAGVIFFLNVSMAGAADVRGVTDTEVKIGCLTDTSSVAAYAGVAVGQAFKDFFAYVNDNGGINGRKIKVIVEDNGYFPKTSLPAAKKLIMKDKVFAIPHCLGSAASAVIMPICKKERVPMFPNGANFSFYEPVKDVIFVPYTSYYSQAGRAVDWIVSKEPNAKIGILYQDDSMGKDQLAGAKNAMKFYGKKLTKIEGFRRGTVDFSSQIMAMRDAKCGYVLVSSMVRATSQVLNQAAKIGYKAQFIGNLSSINVKLAELAPNASDGYMATSAYVPLDADVPGIKELRKVMKKYSGDKYAMNDHYIMGWIYSSAFAEGLRLAGRDLTIDSFIKGMERINHFEMGDVMGPMTFGPKRHAGSVASKMVKFDLKNKKFIILDKEWVSPKSPQF